MANPLLRITIRSMFRLTGRDRALRQASGVLGKYMLLAEDLSPEAGRQCVYVPPMRGVDENMRGWSFFMILEHNVIVNRSITAMVTQLVRGERLSGLATINPKTDVMPSPFSDESHVAALRDSIDHHVRTVRELDGLRGTTSSMHPVFGRFDAHDWNCMFAFHLGLHYPQAEYVVRSVKRGPD